MHLATWAERNGVARVSAWATAEQSPVDKVVTEVGSALNGHRRKFLALLGDPAVTRIVVEHRDRFCRFDAEYGQAALAVQGRELVVVDTAGVDDDVVRDMTAILTLMCARLYGNALLPTVPGVRSPPVPMTQSIRWRDGQV